MDHSPPAPLAAPALAIVALGADDPAARLRIGTRSVLEWTLRALGAALPGTPVVLAAPDGWGDEAPRDVTLVGVPAGATRMTSLAAAFAANDRPGAILVHDPDRPLLEPAAIAAFVRDAAGARCAVLTAPVTSSVKRVADGRITADVPREHAVLVGSPWLVERSALDQAMSAHPDAANLGHLAAAAGLRVQAVVAHGQWLGAVRSRHDVEVAERAITAGLLPHLLA